MSVIEYICYILGAIAAGATIWGFVLYYKGKRKKELPPSFSQDIITIEEPLSWEEVYRGVEQLSRKIENEYKPDLVVAISSGGAIVGGMISRLLDIPIAQITRSSPRLEETKPGKSETILLPAEIIKGSKILLIDDIVRSGFTLSKYSKWIEEERLGPSEIKSATLMLAGEHWQKEPDFFIYRATKIDIGMPWDFHKVSR